ncbi:ROK family protein, partial [Candidatus Saccharibacteria bacterium 32-45-3]
LKHYVDAPIFIENDANLAALGETLSLRKQPRVSLYVTISTGIGTGIVTNGHIYETFGSCEGGKIMLEYDGIVRRWEQFASGKSMYETYGKFARDIRDRHIWHQFSDKMSRGFLAMIPVVMPDTVIIGGSIGTYYERYEHMLLKQIREKLEPHLPMPEFRQATHPEEAVIYGCYHYAKQRLSKSPITT